MHMRDRNRITSCDKCETVYDLEKHEDHIASEEHCAVIRALTGESHAFPRKVFLPFFSGPDLYFHKRQKEADEKATCCDPIASHGTVASDSPPAAAEDEETPPDRILKKKKGSN